MVSFERKDSHQGRSVDSRNQLQKVTLRRATLAVVLLSRKNRARIGTNWRRKRPEVCTGMMNDIRGRLLTTLTFTTDDKRRISEKGHDSDGEEPKRGKGKRR
jgi:hypothetical protein